MCSKQLPLHAKNVMNTMTLFKLFVNKFTYARLCGRVLKESTYIEQVKQG